MVIAVATTLAACGGTSEQQKAAEELQKSAEADAEERRQHVEGRRGHGQGLEAMAKGLARAGAARRPVKPVDPVSFRELQTVMPDVAGWEKASPTGERMTSPFSFSQASVTYKKGDAEIEQKIMDSGFNQLLFTPFTMFMAAGYEKETPGGLRAFGERRRQSRAGRSGTRGARTASWPSSSASDSWCSSKGTASTTSRRCTPCSTRPI